MCNYISEYLYEKEVINKRDSKSIKKYRTVLVEFFGENPSKEQIESITAEYIVEWLDKLNNATSTKNQKLGILKVFWLFLSEEYGFKNVPRRISNRRETVIECEKRVEILEEEEVKKLISTMHNNKYCNTYERDLSILLFGLRAGLRVSEVSELLVENIDMENKQVTVIGKRSKRRVVPINNELHEALERYIRIYNPQGKLFDITTAGITKMLYRWLDKAEVEHKVSFHKLRHTFSTNLISNGTDVRVLQNLLGHSSPFVTQSVYVHSTTNERIAAVNTLV